MTEQVAPAGNLTSTGSISFTDVDFTDVHTVSATAVGAPAGHLTATKSADTTDTGTGGSIGWNYSVADSAVEYLAAGQTKVESFTISLDDGHGGVVTKQVDVTITGTNDAPVFTSSGGDLAVPQFGGTRLLHVSPDGTIVDTGTVLSDNGQYDYRNSIGDVNGDGRADVLISGGNDSGHLYYNAGNGQFVDSGQVFPANFQVGNAIVDVDNDGRPDLVFQNGLGANSIDIYHNDGAAGFHLSQAISAPPQPSGYSVYGSPVFGDVNGDGFADMVVPHYDAGHVVVRHPDSPQRYDRTFRRTRDRAYPRQERTASGSPISTMTARSTWFM